MRATIKSSGIYIIKNRKIRVFFFFLILTSIIWMLIELSKTYTSSVTFKINYTNLPTDKLLQKEPLDVVDIAVKAPGFTLLKYKFKKHKILFDLKGIVKGSKAYYIVPNKQISQINTQLSSETEAISILIDTLFFELGKNISKKVPVKSKLDIKYKLGYNALNGLKIEPDSVVITGPEKYIDTIYEVSTEYKKREDVYEDIRDELVLNLDINSEDITVSPSKVLITCDVDKFTEGSFLIPVTIINKPINLVVNSFPKQIEVVYQAGLSNFNKINESSFSVVFDFKQYENDTLIKFLTPIIRQKSEFVSSVKINPHQIEFLIQKQ